MNITEAMVTPMLEAPRKNTENIMPVMSEYSTRRDITEVSCIVQIFLRMMNADIPPTAMVSSQTPNAEPPKISARTSKPYSAVIYAVKIISPSDKGM